MSAANKIFITGASGFLGSALTDHFRAKGDTVFALTRSKRTVSTNHHITFDLFNISLDLSETPDIFIHAAYVKQEKGIDALAVNVNAAKKIIEFCRSKGTFPVFISSLSSSPEAESVYGKQKYAIEKLFIEAGGAVVRPGLILGNGGLFASMRDYLKVKQRIPLFGNGLQPIQSVHIDDLTNAISMITKGKIKGSFVVAEEEPVPYKTFYEELCSTLNVKPKFVRAGFGITSFLISFSEFFGMKLPIAKENLLGLKQMKHVPSQADLNKLGVKLRTWKESLAQLGTHH